MELTPVMTRFILHWGEMGSRWGVTGLPGLHWMFNSFYLWFARNRLAISAWLGYTKAWRGKDGVCQVK